MSRWLVCLVILAMAAGVTHAQAAPLPVILVAPPGAGDIWGEYAAGRGLLGAFRDQGYRLGQDLFVFHADPQRHADPYQAAVALDRLVRALGQGREGARVNLVGYSLGGLTLAHYLQGLAGPDQVDTAVLIATPLAGSFLATHYRRQWEGWHQEARARGSFPYLAHLPLGTVPEHQVPPFTDESSYVSQRASAFYAPLYGLYLQETRWLNWPGTQSNARSFEAYLWQQHRPVLTEHLVEAGLPPLGEGAEPGALGHDLSRAFYELMALDSGRRLYVMERTGVTQLAVQVFGDGYVPVDAQDALRHYSWRLATVIGGHVLETARAPLLAHLLGWLGERLGYDPTGAPLRRVQQRQVLLPVGSGPDGAPEYVEIPVNYRLSQWHHWREGRCRPRLVVLASRVTNWLGPLMPSLGSHDLVVELASALPLPGPHDVFRVWSGRIRPDHFSLLGRQDVQRFIVGELTRPSGVTREHWPRAARTPQKTWSWQERGSLAASSWRPAHLRIHPERMQGLAGEVHLELDLPALPAGGHWLITTGDRWDRVERPGTYQLRVGVLDRHPLEVGLRPVPGPGREWERELRHSVAYQVHVAAVFAQLGERVEPPPAREPIRVVLRSKRTTQRRDERTYHQRWLWDLGDGTVGEREGEAYAQLELLHTYHYPGPYQVQFVAYDNHDRVVRHLSWTQHLSSAAQAVRFNVMGLVEPEVRVQVRGPISWVTGRPATFTVEVDVAEVPDTRREVVSVDPGVRFQVYWERPGFFTVEAAATVRLTYAFPEGAVTVTNTYLGSTMVRVLAPALTH